MADYSPCDICGTSTIDEDNICRVCIPLHKRSDKCPDCGGDGKIDLTLGPKRIVECDTCDGTGEVDD